MIFYNTKHFSYNNIKTTDTVMSMNSTTHLGVSLLQPPKVTAPLGYAGGWLGLVLGPMFSGKSTTLLHVARSYIAIGKRVLVIRHQVDTRYDQGKGLTTHNGDSIHSGMVSACIPRLSVLFDDDELLAQIKVSDVVCIEELQFFHNVVEDIRKLVEVHQKHVFCAGLIADYRRHNFGDVHKLLPLADDVVHLKALCSKCNDGTPAIFTQRVVPHEDLVIVGEKESYRAVCRQHYLCALDTTEEPVTEEESAPICHRDMMSSDEITPWYVDDSV